MIFISSVCPLHLGHAGFYVVFLLASVNSPVCIKALSHRASVVWRWPGVNYVNDELTGL